ncbi:hypothetical protein [Mycobacteroides salmoniphilum]|uniref:hypothetical protein n=1 Tax=Mycobacteroides salmoniphilum TaxID=404941 RepID=UPI0019575630|nr:hypothetical protein [Mycobacteroides salmoniphilum]
MWQNILADSRFRSWSEQSASRVCAQFRRPPGTYCSAQPPPIGRVGGDRGGHSRQRELDHESICRIRIDQVTQRCKGRRGPSAFQPLQTLVSAYRELEQRRASEPLREWMISDFIDMMGVLPARRAVPVDITGQQVTNIMGAAQAPKGQLANHQCCGPV